MRWKNYKNKIQQQKKVIYKIKMNYNQLLSSKLKNHSKDALKRQSNHITNKIF